MAIKKFGVQKREVTPASLKLTPKQFVLPGEDHVYTATPPKEATWNRVQLAGRANVPMARRVQALLDFVHGTLAEPTDAERIEERLLSGADSLDLIDVFPVVGYLSEAWSAEANGKLAEFLAAEGVTDGDEAADGEQEAARAEVPEGAHEGADEALAAPSA